MTGLTWTVRALVQGERTLAEELILVAERHRAEHEVLHVARDLARWSRENAEKLSAAAERHLAPGPANRPGHVLPGSVSALPDPVRTGGSDEGELLLSDLRHLHVRSSENSLLWETLAQAAQALRDGLLLELASTCHPRSLRQMRWTNTMIKTLAPQILTVSADPA
jgi:hypothetical protein